MGFNLTFCLLESYWSPTTVLPFIVWQFSVIHVQGVTLAQMVNALLLCHQVLELCYSVNIWIFTIYWNYFESLCCHSFTCVSYWNYITMRYPTEIRDYLSLITLIHHLNLAIQSNTNGLLKALKAAVWYMKKSTSPTHITEQFYAQTDHWHTKWALDMMQISKDHYLDQISLYKRKITAIKCGTQKFQNFSIG